MHARVIRRTHLDHVDEVVEELLVVDAQFVVSEDDSVVEDRLTEAEAQHEVPGMPNRLAHQEKPVLHRLEFAHGLHSRYFTVKPSEEIVDNIRS